MEQMMFRFLDLLNPNIFVLETKFGNVPRYNGEDNFIVGEEKRKQIKLLCNMFSCEYNDGLSVYDKWLSSKPVYVRLKSSTSDVFVSKL